MRGSYRPRSITHVVALVAWSLLTAIRNRLRSTAPATAIDEGTRSAAHAITYTALGSHALN
jgi:hypothetical protein